MGGGSSQRRGTGAWLPRRAISLWLAALLGLFLGAPSTSLAQDEPARRVASTPEPASVAPATEATSHDTVVIEPLLVAKIVALATSASLMISGAIFLAAGRDQVDDADDAPPGTPWDDVDEDYNAGQEKTVIGASMTAIGFVGVLASVIWILADEEAQPHQQGGAGAVTALPMLNQDGVGVWLRHRF